MLSQSEVSNVVVMGDRAGMVEWANSGWRELVGLSLDESETKPIGSLLDRFEVDPCVVSYVSRRFLAAEVCEVEFPFVDPTGRRRWLHVRVNPRRGRDGDVTRFVALAKEIRQGADWDEFDECDLSPVVRECALAFGPELGSRTSFDSLLRPDLPPTYANPDQLTELVRHLIRRASRAIDDEWGTLSLTTGLVGLEGDPIGTRFLAADLPVGPYLYLEVHDTALTSFEEARARLLDPFLPARQSGEGLSFPNAVQWAAQLGGCVELEHNGPFGTAITVVLPA